MLPGLEAPSLHNAALQSSEAHLAALAGHVELQQLKAQMEQLAAGLQQQAALLVKHDRELHALRAALRLSKNSAISPSDPAPGLRNFDPAESIARHLTADKVQRLVTGDCSFSDVVALIPDMFFNKEDTAGCNIRKLHKTTDYLYVVVEGTWQLAMAEEVMERILGALGRHISSTLKQLHVKGKVQASMLRRFLQSVVFKVGWDERVRKAVPGITAVNQLSQHKVDAAKRECCGLLDAALVFHSKIMARAATAAAAPAPSAAPAPPAATLAAPAPTPAPAAAPGPVPAAGQAAGPPTVLETALTGLPATAVLSATPPAATTAPAVLQAAAAAPASPAAVSAMPPAPLAPRGPAAASYGGTTGVPGEWQACRGC